MKNLTHLQTAAACPCRGLSNRKTKTNLNTQARAGIKHLLALAILLLFVAGAAVAQSTAGPNDAGTGANVTGVGATAWSNPGNITSAGSNATAGIPAGGASNYLRGTNYGFNIPTNATILGIQVAIRRQGQTSIGTGVRDVNVRLVKNGTITGDNLAVTGSNWPTSMGIANYGGASNLWGTTWTPQDINNTNFGVVLSANTTAIFSTFTASVDYMRITITYSLPACNDGILTLTSATGTNAQTVCMDVAITSITYSVGGDATGATVSGLPAGVSGSFSGGVFTISGTPSTTTGSPFNYTVTTTGTPSPCVEASINGTITVNPLPTFTYTKTDISCFEAGDGEIEIIPAGGSEMGYQYQYRYRTDAEASWGAWSGWINIDIDFDDLQPGQYEIQVRDSNGCVQLTEEQVIP